MTRRSLQFLQSAAPGNGRENMRREKVRSAVRPACPDHLISSMITPVRRVRSWGQTGIGQHVSDQIKSQRQRRATTLTKAGDFMRGYASSWPPSGQIRGDLSR